jgi:malate dehydrogenase (oxaloacetate-decarboxylating)(NADP+)
MANPTPEIDYDLAMAAREILMATGRSDHPRVNNVLGSVHFRGAMMCERLRSMKNEAGATYALCKPC